LRENGTSAFFFLLSGADMTPKTKKIEIPEGFVTRTIREPGSVCFLHLKGELRHWNLGVLHEIFQRELEAGIVRLVVNLSQINVMLSCHIGAFITYLREVWPKGGDIKLSQISEDNFARFCQMGLNDVISFYKTDEDAFNAFQVEPGKLVSYLRANEDEPGRKKPLPAQGDTVILNRIYRLAYLESLSSHNQQELPYNKLDIILKVILLDTQQERVLLEDSTMERKWLDLKYIDKID
jgi:anti-anti-sigma factor